MELPRFAQGLTGGPPSTRAMRWLELLVLGALAVVLLQGLLLLFHYAVSARVQSVLPASDSLMVESRREPAGVSSEQSLELQARPVFWASRQPLEPLPGDQAAERVAGSRPAGSLKGVTVTGIVANEERSVVIVDYRGSRRRLAPGEDIDGWTLVEVRPDTAVFASAGERDERRLSPAPVVSGVQSGAADSAQRGQPAPPDNGGTDIKKVERLTVGGPTPLRKTGK